MRRFSWAATGWLIWEFSRGGIPWVPAFFVAFLNALSAWSRGWRDRPALFLFWSGTAAYLSTFRWHGGDDTDVSLIPLALLKHGTLALNAVMDPFLIGKTHDFTVLVGGNYLSFHPAATGLLAIPLYVLPVLTGAPISEQFLHHLSKISGTLLTAASAVVFFRAVKGRCSESWAFLVSTVYAFGSFAFSISSQALWQHGPSQLAVALALWGLTREGFAWDLLIGFGLGLAIAIRTDNCWWAMAAGGYLLFHARRRIWGAALGAALPLALLAFYHWYYTGGLAPPQSVVLGDMFVPFMPDAWLALAFSPTRGLLFFCPAALFGLWAGRNWRKEPLTIWLLGACAATWIFFSCFTPWVGGMSFGPRYFSVVAMVLLFLCSGVEDPIRSSPWALSLWSAACAFSILVHAIGAYMTWPGNYGVWVSRERAWEWTLHPLLNLLRTDGPLIGWPWPARAAFLAFLAVVCVKGTLLLRARSRST